MTAPAARRVLMVCTGNICRSPTMEAVFRAKAAARGLDLHFDSAGTEDYHVGDPPDPRSQAAARLRGYELGELRARHFSSPADFLRFDLILAADRTHLTWLERRRPADGQARLAQLLGDADLPDPYYGDEAGFHAVVAAVEIAAERWLDHIAPQ